MSGRRDPVGIVIEGVGTVMLERVVVRRVVTRIEEPPHVSWARQRTDVGEDGGRKTTYPKLV